MVWFVGLVDCWVVLFGFWFWFWFCGKWSSLWRFCLWRFCSVCLKFLLLCWIVGVCVDGVLVFIVCGGFGLN